MKNEAKVVYLINTNGTREFWTVERLPEGDPEYFFNRTMPIDIAGDEPVVAVLRSLYNEESVVAEDTSMVEDDSSWDAVALTADELDHLFDNVKIIDSREFE